MKKLFASLALLAAGSYAAIGNPAFVNALLVQQPDSRAYVELSTSSFGASAFSIDLTSNNAVGKDMLAVILFAMANNKQIVVIVESECQSTTCPNGTPVDAIEIYRSRN